MPKKSKTLAMRKSRLRAELHGRTFKPRPQPPIISIGHWFPGTVVRRSSGDAEFSVNDLANIFRDQWGLFATDTATRVPVALRFMSVSFWYFDSVLPQSYQVLIRNLVNFGEMVRLQDFPALNQWGRVGYEWPASQQFIQHNHDDASGKPIKIDVTSSATWLVHVTILWRPLNGQSYAETARTDPVSTSHTDVSSEMEILTL